MSAARAVDVAGQHLGICRECSAIDFERGFANLDAVLNERGDYIADLGDRPSSSDSAACSVCRLLASVCVSSPTGEYELRAYSFFRSYGEVNLPPWNGDDEMKRRDFVVLGVTPKLSKEDIPPANMHYTNHPSKCWDTGFIARVGDRVEADSYCMQVVEPQVDIDYIRECVSFCQDHHTETCRGSQADDIAHIGMKLIDCETKEVVDFHEGYEYAALSYVWGKRGSAPSPTLGYATDSGCSQYPTLVNDALSLSQSLGLRYLWVDQFCIDQTNARSRDLQISKMDAIYSHAVFTIIAAAGSDPSRGLPGVENTPRASQPQAHTSAGPLVSTLPHPTSEIRRSTWST